MAIEKIGAPQPTTPSPALKGGKESFNQALRGGGERQARASGSGPSEVEPRRVVDGAGNPQGVKPGCVTRAPGVTHARAATRVEGAIGATASRPAQVLDRVSAAQQRLERILELAQSGKSFTPAELIAMQAQVYSASQQLDLAGKVVEKATGGVKQILQTQL
jgi:hypothetical protein